MKNEKLISELFLRYLANQCSEEEVRFLLQHFKAGENEKLLKSLMRKEFEAFDDTYDETNEEVNANLKELFNKIRKKLS
ncbi:MAG: hypothetical protein WKG06_15845 [Segetibacter sp.]